MKNMRKFIALILIYSFMLILLLTSCDNSGSVSTPSDENNIAENNNGMDEYVGRTYFTDAVPELDFGG